MRLTIPACKEFNGEEKKCEGDECCVWENMAPLEWHNSVSKKDSIFAETYESTRRQIVQTAMLYGHDVIIEVGCGTGDVIGKLNTQIQCYGLDINGLFIEFCDAKYPHDHCEFLVQDACNLTEWWKAYEDKYNKPLVCCVNNTLNIMPEEIRGLIIAQMISVAGANGRCLLSYWNGNFFSHAVVNYYKSNPALCGNFDISKHVDFQNRILTTSTNYSTHWFLPAEVQRFLRACDVNIDTVVNLAHLGEDHINTEGLAIFAWFSQECSSMAKTYYDSDDAQKFYCNIWGEETVHIGRYDLLTQHEKTTLSEQQQISRAQTLHEAEFAKLIKSKFPDQPMVRVLDMGCGYGGLLRRLWEDGVVWSAVGVDISRKMCQQARHLNHKLGCDKDIAIFEESYLHVTIPDESVDLVISMDALLHVGPDGQRTAIKEAARVLRPGGWMIFTDIMQQEITDPVEMQPIYDRIHLSKLGTVSNYKEAMIDAGFRNFGFMQHSSNVSTHYGTIHEVLIKEGASIGISKEYAKKMESGLCTWRDLAPKNIVWGFTTAKKTEKLSTS